MTTLNCVEKVKENSLNNFPSIDFVCFSSKLDTIIKKIVVQIFVEFFLIDSRVKILWKFMNIFIRNIIEIFGLKSLSGVCKIYSHKYK